MKVFRYKYLHENGININKLECKFIIFPIGLILSPCININKLECKLS